MEPGRAPGSTTAPLKSMRWRYLILPSLQLKFMFFIFWSLLIFGLVVGWDVFYSSGRILISATSEPQMEEALGKAAGLLVLKLGFYASLIGIVSILLSHRVAGPVYRLGIFLRAVAQGDLSQRLRFRQGDELTETAESFNSMVDSLRERLLKDRVRSQNLAQELKALAQDIRERDPDLADRLEHIGEEISGVTSGFVI